MNLITSYSFTPWKSKHIWWDDAKFFLTLAKHSLEEHARLYQTRPVIYTDSIGEKVFSALTSACDVINCLDNIYTENNIDPKVYSFAKMYVYGLQTEPFCFFDTDLVPKQAIDYEGLGVDLVFYNYEDIAGYNSWCNSLFNRLKNNIAIVEPGELQFVNQMLRINDTSDGNSMMYMEHPDHIKQKGLVLDDVFNEVNIAQQPAFNTSVLYCRNIDFIKPYVRGVIKMLSDNSNQLDKFEGGPVMPVEQQYLALLANKYNQSRLCILTDLDAQIDNNAVVDHMRYLHHSNNYYDNYLGAYAKADPELSNKFIAEHADESCDNALRILKEYV